jgi:hypothetical protein
LIKQRKNLNLPWLKAVFDSRTAGVFLATRNAHFYSFFKRSFAKHFCRGIEPHISVPPETSDSDLI